jgi:hypothetical protein
MLRDDRPAEPDPSEVQPTDNSAGNPVDLERLEEVQEESEATDP